jgi:hypothetical protein
MAKNKKEERKIYRDFTMEEFDEFALEAQAEGAHHYKNAILTELERRRDQVVQLMFSLPSGSKIGKDLAGIVAGLTTARNYIENMNDYEDCVGCPECGSF